MSTTPGYGETPAGSSSEQPEWLRKRSDAASSSTADSTPRYDDGAPRLDTTPPPASPYGGYGQPAGPSAQQAQPPYPVQHQTPPQYQGTPQYQAPYQPPYPAPYPQPGAPWAPVDPHAKSRLAAGLLGIFLGAFGIHRFYLGYTRVGMVMLLMTLLSFGFLSVVTSIWGLVEGILYLTDKTGRYSHDATGRPLRD